MSHPFRFSLKWGLYSGLTPWIRSTSSNLSPQPARMRPRRYKPKPKMAVESRGTVLPPTGCQGRGTAPTSTIACAKSAEALSLPSIR